MTITIKHDNVRSTDALDSAIEERILALQTQVEIERADVRLQRLRGSSPALALRIHLATPGPDLVVETREHTWPAALRKAVAELERKIASRRGRRQARVRSNLQGPAHVRYPRSAGYSSAI